jgi:hypothetical protein
VVNATCSPSVAGIRDGASLIFNLSEYTVIDTVGLPSGRRRVVVQAAGRDDACPSCGVVSTRVHQWTRQRVRDLPAGGEGVEVGRPEASDEVRGTLVWAADVHPVIMGSPTSFQLGRAA